MAEYMPVFHMKLSSYRFHSLCSSGISNPNKKLTHCKKAGIFMIRLKLESTTYQIYPSIFLNISRTFGVPQGTMKGNWCWKGQFMGWQYI